MSDDDIQVGEVYYSDGLYGEPMNRLCEALEGAGFRLELDVLLHQATLYMEADDAE